MPTMFEGSYLGDGSRISDGARLECGICWHVYDPAEGDEVWQIPPGTPFSALPEHWSCPNCDAPRHKFMVVDAL
ncbi:rubredoxin [Parazoarcus communis]|uniref:Rubredoxin n=2 Tax=Parazoarcus communis TaxID=41977 RepID=A0A2U8GVA8_9RHOO|nr:rubredoxin [Parazoarcus communis]